jgi:Membrane domain of glycerophosphoryl diester phosphodiesterase
MQQFAYSQQPRPAGGLVADSLSFFRAALTQVWPLALLASIVFVGPAQWATTGLQWSPGMELSPDLLWRWGVAILLSLLGFFIVGSALLHQMDQLARGLPGPAGASLVVAARSAPTLILACLLFIVLACVAALVAVAVGGAAGALLGTVGSVLVGLLLVIAMLVLVMRFAFMQQAVVLDGATAGGSLRRSWQLTRGNVWRVMTVLGLIGLIGFAWGLVSTLAAGLFGSIAGGIAGASAGTLVSAGITIGIYTLYLPLTMAAGLVVWNDLAQRAPPAA